MLATIIVLVLVLVAAKVLHAGHRGAKRRGQRGIVFSWNSRYRRPYISVPLPGGFRLGRKL